MARRAASWPSRADQGDHPQSGRCAGSRFANQRDLRRSMVRHRHPAARCGSRRRRASMPATSATHEFRIPAACYGPPDTQCRFIIMADAGPQTGHRIERSEQHRAKPVHQFSKSTMSALSPRHAGESRHPLNKRKRVASRICAPEAPLASTYSMGPDFVGVTGAGAAVYVAVSAPFRAGALSPRHGRA